MAVSIPEIFLLDDSVWLATQSTGLPIYDFDFRSVLPCRTPWDQPAEITAVARMGAFENYTESYDALLAIGLRLINSPDEHLRASQLAAWYPLLEDITPRSRWYDEFPDVTQISREFCWPVFIKGNRQTNRHQRQLSIVRSAEQCEEVLTAYRNDPILRWQPLVVREYRALRFVEDPNPDRIPSSFEFRTFWWRGTLVGAGRYWWEGRNYDWSESEKQAGIAVAERAAERLSVPFLVVDMAMTADGDWIVIECNDAQESGYAGVSPIALWQNVVQAVKYSSPLRLRTGC